VENNLKDKPNQRRIKYRMFILKVIHPRDASFECLLKYNLTQHVYKFPR